ncbi:hypothetical protein CBR_g45499 [Chara braunii]|uniref:Reverse transcriptase/retrotransposon-derived protein RNase H-like domain-containing protein n=1 Tax=Chara braunii TaxID=69332 RepID=A0A388LYU9_CHABU|nr:hypothetical protein CBR_g45499 [Chara braunii]|eukprot:GBG87441.1 hypothetical protein CBR_g45499 [Chara braunii]
MRRLKSKVVGQDARREADGGRKLVTLDDLIDALDKCERAPSNVPKVETFHFKGDKVSDSLDLIEQALVGLSDEVNLQRVLRYVLHRHHREVTKVVDAAGGSWTKFGDLMRRKYRLGDDLLTMADLEAMNKEYFFTIEAFVHEFKKRARKVHGISEEAQCATFLGLLTGSEATELTKYGEGSERLTWATIDKGVEEGSLDQVEQHQMRLQRRKRKERDATASGTPGVKRIVTDVLAALGYDNEAEIQKRGVPVAQGRTSGAIEEEVGQKDYSGGETGSQMGHTIRFCQQRRNDELAGLISSCMDGDIFDRWGTHIDPRTPGGIREEALKRAAAGPPAAPAMFRIWQEREDSGVRIEEIVDENEKVTQQLKAGTIKEEPIIVESDDEEEEVRESALTILEKMEDLLAKVGWYQDQLRVMCEEAREWELNLPKVMLYGSGPESSSGPQGCPSVATVGAGPKSGMTFRPPTSHGRVPQATQTRGQSKATASQGPSQAPTRAPPRKDPEPERRKEVVEVQEEEDEGDDEEDERLRQEEDRRAEQRAKKRGAQGGAEPSLHDGVPKRKKYAVWLEEGFDVERMVDKLLEGHNDLMNLKDILASAPRLRGELKGRLSRRHMIRAMQTVSPHITQPYIDDLAVKGPKKKEEDELMPGVRRFVWKHVQDIDQVLGLLEEHNLTASGPKSKHCMREATILGFVCNEKGRRPEVKKTDKILEWPVPFQSITDVRSFLGTCGFWRTFVKDFATKTEHLRKLVRQDQEWVWGEDQEKVVERMKGEFREGGLVLGAPNYEVTEEKPFVVETDAGPTALGGVLIQAEADGKERPLRFESRTLNTTERNYSQFTKETLALERIPGDKNRADGLSRINWDGANQESIEDTPPVDGFLNQAEDVRLHINEWSLRVRSCVTHPIWLAPRGYKQKEELVLKPFQEEDPWGSRDVGWMMRLALAGTHSLAEEVRTIEEGPTLIEEHEQLMGGMYLLTNTLLQGNFSQRSAASLEEVELLIPESQDDEFEEGEIKEAFHVEEYDGIYRELGLLLSCEIRDRDASAKAQKMRHLYVVRDDHLFIKRQVGNPKRIVCGRNRQIDVIAALHDGIAGGHRGVSATCPNTRAWLGACGGGGRKGDDGAVDAADSGSDKPSGGSRAAPSGRAGQCGGVMNVGVGGGGGESGRVAVPDAFSKGNDGRTSWRMLRRGRGGRRGG